MEDTQSFLVDRRASFGDLLFDVPGRQVERATDVRLDTLAHRQRRHRIGCLGAGLQESFRPALAQSLAQRADRRGRAGAPFAFGIDQHPGERLARQ